MRRDPRDSGEEEDHEGNWTWIHRRRQGMIWNPYRRKGLYPELQSTWDGPHTDLNRLNDVVQIRTSSSEIYSNITILEVHAE